MTEEFWKVIAIVMITAILGVCIGQREKTFALLLTMSVCTIGAVSAVRFLEPLIQLLREMELAARLDEGLLSVLLKTTGIALVAEFGSLLCKDVGNNALEKIIQLLGNTVVLYLSIPIINSLLAMLRQLLGTI